MNNIYRKTYAEINLPNLYENYKNIQKLIPEKTIIPVVKANAYGHGVLEVVEYLREKSIDHYAVSLLEEALEIRSTFPDIEILMMGIIHPDQYEIASKNNITISISNYDQLDALLHVSYPLSVHLKIDTGMNRLGFKNTEEINGVIKLINQNEYITLQGIYTHFATADDNLAYYNMQKARFEAVLKHLNTSFKMIHISNSSSTIKYEKNIDYTTHTRLGISLYGLSLDDGMDFLKNTYRLISHISEIKKLKAGDKVGYGATYTASEDEIIGVLPIGYADGFIRKNQTGYVEINNKKYKIIGRICMDQLFIKIDDTISKEDEVILFGGIISIDEVAKRLDTINYEIICQITSRVPKIYIK